MMRSYFLNPDDVDESKKSLYDKTALSLLCQHFAVMTLFPVVCGACAHWMLQFVMIMFALMMQIFAII